jgi:hypothetical protein
MGTLGKTHLDVEEPPVKESATWAEFAKVRTSLTQQHASAVKPSERICQLAVPKKRMDINDVSGQKKKGKRRASETQMAPKNGSISHTGGRFHTERGRVHSHVGKPKVEPLNDGVFPWKERRPMTPRPEEPRRKTDATMSTKVPQVVTRIHVAFSLCMGT